MSTVTQYSMVMSLIPSTYLPILHRYLPSTECTDVSGDSWPSSITGTSD